MAQMKVLTDSGVSYLVNKIDESLEQKVDKVSGKGLSTNDFTTAEKTKLSGIGTGAQANVIEAIKVNGVAQDITSKAVNIDLSTYAIKTEVSSALNGKVDKVDGYSLMSSAEKSKLANLPANANETYATKNDISSVYKPKGSVASKSNLPSSASIGDVYNVKDTDMNYVWAEIDGKAQWDQLGTSIDLSNYYTKAQVNEIIGAIEGDVGSVYTKSEIDGMVSTINGNVSALQTEVGKKANASSVYTKAEVDSAIDNDVAVVNARVTSEVATLNTVLSGKVNTSDLVAISNSEIDALF